MFQTYVLKHCFKETNKSELEIGKIFNVDNKIYFWLIKENNTNLMNQFFDTSNYSIFLMNEYVSCKPLLADSFSKLWLVKT